MALLANKSHACPLGQADQAMGLRAIPSSGEKLPVVGLGTWQTFDVGEDAAKRQNLRKVLETLVQGGGSVIDSSRMYGSSESVVGALIDELDIRDKLFLATKVWTEGKQSGTKQMQESINKMHASTMDLMQVHNLIDAKTHLKTLADWKQAGKIRYLGLTHHRSGGHDKMLRLMQDYPLDFIQINYSIIDREAEQKILPLAQDKGIAVLVNRPFEKGVVFSKVKDQALPEWSADFDCHSWGQFFLKFILANPAVTCVIPGTSKVHHLQDNLCAGRGRFPDQAMRDEMLQYLSG